MEVSSEPLEVSSVPLEVSSVPLEVSSVPLEVSSVPLEVSSVPFEVNSVPLEVSSVPLEVSSVPLEPLEVISIDSTFSDGNLDTYVLEDSDNLSNCLGSIVLHLLYVGICMYRASVQKGKGRHYNKANR